MTGEFDLSTADELRECLANVGPRVMLDMTLTEFIDSTTLNVLLAARNEGSVITIANPPAPVRRVLEVTGFDDVFTVTDSDPESVTD